MKLSPELNACVDRDVSCVTCGYNLRGLQEDGRCSECGANVRPSLVNVLSLARPSFLAQLRGTISSYAIARVIILAGVILRCLPYDLGDLVFTTVLVLQSVSALLYFGGMLGIVRMAREMNCVSTDLLRYVVYVFISFVFALLAEVSRSQFQLVANWSISIAPFLFEELVCRCVGQIAHRSGNDPLFRFTKCARLIIFSALIVTGITVLTCLLSGNTWQGFFMTAGVWGIIDYVAIGTMVVFGVVVVLDTIILWRFRKMLRPYYVGA